MNGTTTNRTFHFDQTMNYLMTQCFISSGMVSCFEWRVKWKSNRHLIQYSTVLEDDENSAFMKRVRTSTTTIVKEQNSPAVLFETQLSVSDIFRFSFWPVEICLNCFVHYFFIKQSPWHSDETNDALSNSLQIVQTRRTEKALYCSVQKLYYLLTRTTDNIQNLENENRIALCLFHLTGHHHEDEKSNIIIIIFNQYLEISRL